MELKDVKLLEKGDLIVSNVDFEQSGISIKNGIHYSTLNPPTESRILKMYPLKIKVGTLAVHIHIDNIKYFRKVNTK